MPSCQQAVTHYYGAGCALFMTNGQPYAELDVVSDCKQSLAATPDRCQYALDDLRSCWGSVKNPATTNSDCDCSQEQDAWIACD